MLERGRIKGRIIEGSENGFNYSSFEAFDMKYGIVGNPLSGRMSVEEKKRILIEAREILGCDCVIGGLDTGSREEFCDCVSDISRKVEIVASRYLNSPIVLDKNYTAVPAGAVDDLQHRLTVTPHI